MNIELTNRLSDESRIFEEFEPGETVEMPEAIAPVLLEMSRLADEASVLIANGRLFPGLSTLAGLSPIIGMLTEFCAARVVPEIETGSVRVDPQIQLLGRTEIPTGAYL